MEAWNASGTELRVGIVEDEKDLARIYEMIMAKMGVPVSFVAYNGADAVARFRDSDPKPQVILMDNRLPSMSGVEATRSILVIRPETRIIFLSADVAARDEALEAGAAAFISKPARMSDIIGAVESARNSTSAARRHQHPFGNEIAGSW